MKFHSGFVMLGNSLDLSSLKSIPSNAIVISFVVSDEKNTHESQITLLSTLKSFCSSFSKFRYDDETFPFPAKKDERKLKPSQVDK